MKKQFFGVAAIGLMLAGCAKNDVNEVKISSSNVISLDATASRTKAKITKDDVMQNDLVGFKVYATTTGGATWYLNGGNNHVCSGGHWGWAGANVSWPSESTSYPMNFYAWFPAAPTRLDAIVANGATPALQFNFEVEGSAANQIDLVAGHAVTDNMAPNSGTLPITFNHILSKVNFAFSVLSGRTAAVQSITVRNVANKDTYNVVTGAWSGAPTGNTSYTYVENTTDAGESFTGNDLLPVYASGHQNHLMLMPQTPAVNWDPASATAPTTQTHIEMLYRISNGGDFIGYTHASSHPGYGSSSLNPAYDGPLYVKVGYPYNSTWAKGKGYTYVFSMPGQSGGYLIDLNYYDKNGVRTDLLVGRMLNIGDAITSGEMQMILEPEVSDWENDETIPVDKMNDVNITNKLKNTTMPFAHAVTPTWTAVYDILDWETNISGGNVEDDALLFIKQSGYPGGNMVDGKLWQTVNLEAGTYKFSVTTYNAKCYNTNDGVYIVASVSGGSGLPNTANIASQAKGYLLLPNWFNDATADETYSFEFTLDARSDVDLGFVANLTTKSQERVAFRKVELWQVFKY